MTKKRQQSKRQKDIKKSRRKKKDKKRQQPTREFHIVHVKMKIVANLVKYAGPTCPFTLMAASVAAKGRIWRMSAPLWNIDHHTDKPSICMI